MKTASHFKHDLRAPLIPLILGSALLGGCVSAYVESLPTAAPLEGAATTGPRHSAFLKVTVDDFAGITEPGQVEEAVDQVSKESGFFSWYSFDPARAATADDRVEINLSCHSRTYSSSHPPGGMLRMMASAGTLCVIPCRDSTTECAVTGRVARHGTGKPKSFEVHDSIEGNLYGFYSIPLGLLHRSAPEVLKNELRTLYRRLGDAHAFDDSASGDAMPSK